MQDSPAPERVITRGREEEAGWRVVSGWSSRRRRCESGGRSGRGAKWLWGSAGLDSGVEEGVHGASGKCGVGFGQVREELRKDRVEHGRRDGGGH